MTQAPPAAPVVPVEPQVAKVAILLPLSGPNAQIGQSLLEAAQMALFDLAGDRFELLPRDTKGTPNGAADAARQAVSEGARLILGPLFAADVAAVRPIAQNANVEVLAFTNDWTQAGNGTYVMGFVPGDQVNRVVGFAKSRGVTRYVALAPRNAYGDAVVTALQNTTRQLGGQVAQVERYDPAVTDLSLPAKQVTQAGVQPQAVMLAEGGPRAQGLANALAANGVNPQQVRLLGTGLWDDPTLGQEPALNGAWFAAPAPQTRADFEQRFEQTYGHKPPRIATLSYDATAIAAVLTKMNAAAPFDRTALTNPSGFEGMDGLFRLRPNGQVERALAVLEVAPNGARVLDPAPSSFELLGQ
ncbi:penicillin-binding protein activator [Azospirillum rugosum]|uniref:ABC-type branched-subunit amino acid transport system substrate-binding protein n=1 Tax=Azospirillum rugosum TaxID=416170 RepID=A0ABS4SN20_9PROT|nr:ABC-type branched-subunit amino acid transport system substrate-binding protein [Azospirillum rugosum]MDQ0526855.1 ABC-type branched-subunit amino acid transport system substrate-binding protein [Azospirillum rugosum]